MTPTANATTLPAVGKGKSGRNTTTPGAVPQSKELVYVPNQARIYSPASAPTTGTKKKRAGVGSEGALEELRRKQNEELLQILEEEQRAEDEREATLAQVDDPSQRKRLEKIFGVERAKANDRIINITAQHELALQMKAASLK